mgnify:CR=1 FL=1
MVTVTVDDEYRIVIPKDVRDGVEPGDVLFLLSEQTEQGPVFHYAKALHPLDALAEAAIEEYRRGESLSADDVARELGIERPGRE